jgi:HEAT repeat protein
MITRHLLLAILVLPIGCQQAVISQDEPAQPTTTVPLETTGDTQLQLYKEALTSRGSSPQMRISAAELLLFSDDAAARQILLDVLKQSENSPARIAVCRALSDARIRLKPIKDKQDFVQPLCGILIAEDSGIAKLAAEATLIYEYDQISKSLEGILSDSSLTPGARLNAVYALKLQPDMRAAIKLIELLDGPEAQVVAASEKALESLGIPVAKDAEARQEVIAQIKHRGNEEFLREQMVRKGNQVRRLEGEREMWRNQYLAAMEKYYGSIKEQKAVRDIVLVENLSSSQAPVKLWALEKVSQLLVGTANPELPAELGPILLGLLSDKNREVRLRTAGLLPLIGGADSAARLAEQHQVEGDDEVRTEIFVALGVVCGSPIKVSPGIRAQVLEWAGGYLSQEDSEKARKGAEVIRKLLEQNTLPSTEVAKYLGMLAERYKLEKDKAEGALRGGLLSTMAGLCVQGSASKAEAARLYESLFEEALADTTDLVREAAVDGLINIDKTMACIKLRKAGLFDDARIEIRSKVVYLAGEAGGKDDLVWLWEKVGSNAESDLARVAWESMLNVLKRADVAVLSQWMAKFDPANAGSRLSDERRISVFKIAEQRFSEAGKADMLRTVREWLAQSYSSSGDFEQAAKYWGTLYSTANSSDQKQAIVPNLLDAYLRWPNVPMAAGVVNNCLLQKDLDSNSPVVRTIEGFLQQPPAGADPNAVLGQLLAQTEEPAEARPGWQGVLSRWAERLGHAARGTGPESGGD